MNMITDKERILVERRVEKLLNEYTSDDINAAIRNRSKNGKLTSNDIEKIIDDVLEKELGKNPNDEDEERGGDKDKGSKNANKKQKTQDVMQWLNKDETDCAAIMRDLWHPKDQEEEDAYRSLFTKKKLGRKNDNGSVYSFDDHDINVLYSIKNSLAESKIRKMVRKILREEYTK